MESESYWRPEWLTRERDNEFFHSWIFAGLAEKLAKHNDYLSFSVAGIPVIVRNMKGKLIAFRNICSHRHSTIHPAGCGNAMFRCPYHGWTYDVDGIPIGIPDNANSFGFDKEEKKNLALDPVAVETCGNLVFVRLASEGVSLTEWLGSYTEILKQASTTFTENFKNHSWTWACNWKMLIEDSYAYRLYPADGSAFSEAPPRVENSGKHAAIHASLAAEAARHLDSCHRRLKLQRLLMLTEYDRFFIYPNLIVSIDYGLNCLIIRCEPLAQEQTIVDAWLMTSKPADNALYGGPVWRAVTEHWEEFTVGVMSRFGAACEIKQQVIRYGLNMASIKETACKEASAA
jgi:phenylpropionate dioxygenase-like ring-hydroxylating dioxygenase large terminal subunit